MGTDDSREEVHSQWIAMAERLLSGIWALYYVEADKPEPVDDDDPPYKPEPLAPRNPNLPTYGAGR